MPQTQRIGQEWGWKGGFVPLFTHVCVTLAKMDRFEGTGFERRKVSRFLGMACGFAMLRIWPSASPIKPTNSRLAGQDSCADLYLPASMQSGGRRGRIGYNAAAIATVGGAEPSWRTQ